MLAMRGGSLSYAMRRSENGPSSSVRLTSTAYAADLLVLVTDGISTRFSLRSMVVSIYLWRAVDQDGDVLDILVQSHRDKKAAKRFLRKLLKGLRYVPRVIITDKLKSYGAARVEVPGSSTCSRNIRTIGLRILINRQCRSPDDNVVGAAQHRTRNRTSLAADSP
jgi:DDE domain